MVNGIYHSCLLYTSDYMNSVNHNKLLKSIPCVQISHVTKRFGEDLVLKEVNLDLNYGQV